MKGPVGVCFFDLCSPVPEARYSLTSSDGVSVGDSSGASSVWQRLLSHWHNIVEHLSKLFFDEISKVMWWLAPCSIEYSLVPWELCAFYNKHPD